MDDPLKNHHMSGFCSYFSTDIAPFVVRITKNKRKIAKGAGRRAQGARVQGRKYPAFVKPLHCGKIDQKYIEMHWK